jgi:hypothetical protein
VPGVLPARQLKIEQASSLTRLAVVPQNDRMGNECTDVTLSSAIDPWNAEELRADVLESPSA